MEKKINLLLVEDSSDDAELLLKNLNKNGFEINHKLVSNPDDFRTALRSNHWDVVLSDYVMPGFGGMEAWQMFRQFNLDVPFIFISGKVGEESAVKAMKAGVDDFIMKENITRLAPTIERELNEAERRREFEIAEREHKKIQDRYKMVVENANEGIGIIQDGCFQLVNPKISSILGIDAEDLIGKSFRDYIHESDRNIVVKYHNLRMEGDDSTPDVYSFRIRDYEGQLRWIENRVVIIDWEGRPATLNFMADITPRKEAEESLKKTTRTLQEEREELRKKNIALKEILDQIQREKDSIKQRISTNIEHRVKNTLYHLRNLAPADLQQHIDLLEKDLDEIVSPFLEKVKSQYAKLTPRELEICQLIKNQLSSKEIAQFLNISPLTVNKHREIIRKKLNLIGSNQNLISFLQGI